MGEPEGPLDEPAVIWRYFAGRSRYRSDVIVGIGDDAAVTRAEAGWDLVTATDAIFEGIHYPPGIPAAAIGHRALAVNLSDLAAMGAEPLWCTLALSLPTADPRWLEGFANGFFALAERYGTALIGGDTVRGPQGASVTVQGRVRPGTQVLRSGAQPGHGVWVTGTFGDALAGRLPQDPAGSPVCTYLRDRFLFPEPRVQMGRSLTRRASAMLDVSDGLHVDLTRITAASGVGAELDASAVPLSSDLRALAGERALEYALTGGDDYELCFTVPAGQEADLPALASGCGVPVTRIGTIIAGTEVRWCRNGQAFPVPESSFRHF